jgi:hypothetical protein
MYKGRLYYEGEDNYIQVLQLILRENGGAISLTTTWDDQGTFSLDAPLTQAGNRYSTGKVRFLNSAKQAQAVESELDFVVTEESETEVYVEGTLRERGETYKFEGDLSK